jgi:carbonic anhydrase
MSAVDDYASNNEEYALTHAGGAPGRPSKHIAVVACMDARMSIPAMLGMRDGEAHVIRNAGGAVTDDVIRSLAISQRLLGTREIMLIHHSDCGMLTTTEDEFKRAVETETGIRPPWAVESFADVEQDVRQSIARLMGSPFIPHKDAIRGFVFDVDTGKLNEVV